MISKGRASRWRRGCALLVDYAAVSTIGFLLVDLFYEPLVAAGDAAHLAGLAIVLVYFGCFNSWLGCGRSLGKRLLGLRVVKTDGSLLSIGAGALRGVMVCLPLLVGDLSFHGENRALESALFLLGCGILAASFYLLIFNGSGRTLHDFLVSSRVDAPDLKVTEGAVWPGHSVNAALICLASVVYPLFAQPTPLIKAVRQAVESVPEVGSAKVQFLREWKQKSFVPSGTERLDVQATLGGAPANLPYLAARLEDAVFKGHETEIGQMPVTIRIHFGARLGIAGLAKQPLRIAIGSFNAGSDVPINTSVDIWHQHQAINQKSITCADKAHPDKVIEGCSFFLTLPNIEPQRRLAAHVNRSVAYIAKDDFVHAADDLTEALKVAPDNFELLGVHAFALERQGEFEKALLDHERLVKLKPDDFNALYNRGLGYFQTAQYAKAAEDFLRAAKLKDAPYAAIFEFLSSTRAGTLQPERLTSYAATRTDKKWPFPVVQFYLGQISVQALLAAASGKDEQCEAHFYLGQWHLLNGNRAEGLSAMGDALAACPKSFTEYAAALAETKRQGG